MTRPPSPSPLPYHRARVSDAVNAESLAAAEARLKETKEELERLRQQKTSQEQKLKSAHAEELRSAGLERDKLVGSVEQLKVRKEVVM